uniref:Ventricular zone-expressed PH domain-containing protein homolog 1 isoform X1 n=1 Tax=Geotrypetes seraphini TaxID=260995 RepID=A0A6P8SA60_GEOSA|nr:ventricular zone-expressed PH domain-containing protein homolog 1 isoform X1 [Geotrypetes seraphini]XP_033815160.1 ventricular zone-expressed PH domain-containing protein homolog 1 isoform X1 [Geotrypetes seraphini]
MHHLFSLVLGQKDLSRAGDLFSLDDAEIEDSLSEALEQIRLISSASDYETNDNDQAVVEICITRITTAIRETETIEKHGRALVALWESCLEQNLRAAGREEDTPHAKIASDIMSCIVQNYDRPFIMTLAVPIAVKFLQRGDKALCRNMSSYLSLAAIAKADLLGDHMEVIVTSVLQGNAMLLRVLPSVYEQQPQLINDHLTELVAQMSHLDQGELHHLLRLVQTVTKRKQPQVLKNCIPFLTNHLRDPNHNDIILNILMEISDYEPQALISSLSVLKDIGEHCPSLLGQIAKIYGAVGLINEENAKVCLTYLVNQLANMEHSFHHIFLMEIKNITDTFSNILGTQGRNIYRMSNSFTAITKLLIQQLENETALSDRGEDVNETESTTQKDDFKSVINKNEEDEQLQIKKEAYKEKTNAEDNAPEPIGRSSLGQASKEERMKLKFNRTHGLAVHVIRTKCTNVDTGQHTMNIDLEADMPFPDLYANQKNEGLLLSEDTEESQLAWTSVSHSRATYGGSDNVSKSVQENCHESSVELMQDPAKVQDKLYVHLKENLTKVKAFVMEIGRKIPVPDECIIEDTVRSCVAKLVFSCPMKGHYCLYGKSSFTLISRQPQLWIHIMFLFQQSLFPAPLSVQSKSIHVLKVLWEKTRQKGTDSFENAMIQSTFPHKKDLDHVQSHLEEVRFFDLFAFSEEAGVWQCFMCNNPEKATVVNQEGQPLIEGKLKEKQVRWKFIKRWKTRYFTLAGNQLLFRKGKSKDDSYDCPIELSKVQSVKVVTKKRRDRSLPRAFEIFTESKTYVFKAKDEKNTEEWLQCINVAIAQAKERENREAMTYL